MEEQINAGWSRDGEKGENSDALPLGKQAPTVVVLGNDAQKLLCDKCLLG